MKLLLLGMNHRTAPLELRERLAVADPGPPLQKLVSCDEIDEAVLLSTCNRVEVIALTRSPDAARLRLRSFFRRELAGDAAELTTRALDEALYEYRDGEAMRHVMRVAAALDSMVVGEPQILGQIKDAYRAAVECGASGPILDRLYQRAFATAKRVRTDTRIAEGPLSVARVAVALARQIFEDMTGKHALLIGAGEMAELALGALRDAGLASLAIANRSAERAAQLAVAYGATAHGLDELPRLLAESDVVLTSIGGDRPILRVDTVEPALRARRGRPIFVIDIGVPRNADPAIDRLDDVYRYDIDALGAVASDNAEERRREQARAEAIVAEEQQRFEGWFAALRAVPTIRDLRGRVEVIRARETSRALSRLALDPERREAVELLTRSLVNKILHAPLARLRREAEREEGMAYLELARLLFGLDDADWDAAGAEAVDAPDGPPDPGLDEP
ncbi:MAG TPA: glutamyl-tRNA reductase [Myxococcota bacterium]|nr:glutamyl-tRNA reductase [Myxococcota bacterium]